MSETLQESSAALRDAVENNFYGEITFVVRSGEITLIRKLETTIPRNQRKEGKNPHDYNR